jgi:hypothetical protein
MAAAADSSSQLEQQQQQQLLLQQLSSMLGSATGLPNLLVQQLSSMLGSATGLPNLPAASGGEPSATPAGSAGTSAAAATAAASVPALPALPDAAKVSTEEVSDALLQLMSALNEQKLLSCDEALEMWDALAALLEDTAAAAAFMHKGYRQLTACVLRGNGELAVAVLRKHLLPPQQQQLVEGSVE